MDSTRIKQMLDAIPDAYLVLDGSGSLVDFKPSSGFRLPSGVESVIGKHLTEILPDWLADAFMLKLKEVLDSGDMNSTDFSLTFDGTPSYFEARFTPFDKNQILAIIRDMTNCERSMQAIQTFMNASEDLTVLMDRQGYIRSINENAAGMYGKKPEEMIGTIYWDYFAPETAADRRGRMEKVFETGEPAKIVHLSEGKIYETTMYPVYEVAGNIGSVAYFLKDTTDKFQTDHELIESAVRHSRLFNENPVPMYIYDTTTLEILDANTAMINSYGYSREELISMKISEIRPIEDVSRVLENVSDMRSRQVYLGLWRHTKKDGTVVDVEITSGDFPFQDRPARLVLCADVTEKLRIAKALEEREKQYRHLFEFNPMPVFIIDPETMEILNVNRATLNHYGYEKEELLRLSLLEIRPPEDVESTRGKIRALTEPVEKIGVVRHLKKDGTEILMDISSHEIVYKGRKARFAICNDVTDQIHARKALEESEVKFRSIVQSSPMGMHMYKMDDNDRLILSGANPAAEKILGMSHGDLIGSTLEEAFPGVLDTKISQWAHEVCLSGTSWHQEHVRFKDKRGDGSFEFYAFKTGHRTMAMFFLDTTEKGKARDALQESEEKFRQAFLTSPDPMTISRLEDGVLLEVNDGFTALTGYTREEILGKSSLDLDLWAAEAQRDGFTKELLEKGRFENYEVDIKSKDGSIKHVLLSGSTIQIQNTPRLFTIARDISDLKKAEEALMLSEEQLRTSLSEKEMLLKEIHHRVKNNLQVISGLLDLQSHHFSDPVSREIFKESQNRVVAMALIHEELYQSVNQGRVDFGDYIHNLAENLMISYGVDRKRINLIIVAKKTEIVVDTAIPCGLIINELMTNALKHAFPDERKGTISLSFRQMKNKDYLLSVSDDGVGIPKDVDINNTSTLGMQLVTVLVGHLGGTLKVRRKEGTGYTIKFREYNEAGSILY